MSNLYIYSPYYICVDLFGSGCVESRGCTSNCFETVEGLEVVAAKDVVPGSSVARDWYISSHLLFDEATVPNHYQAVELFATQAAVLCNLFGAIELHLQPKCWSLFKSEQSFRCQRHLRVLKLPH